VVVKVLALGLRASLEVEETVVNVSSQPDQRHREKHRLHLIETFRSHPDAAAALTPIQKALLTGYVSGFPLLCQIAEMFAVHPLTVYEHRRELFLTADELNGVEELGPP